MNGNLFGHANGLQSAPDNRRFMTCLREQPPEQVLQAFIVFDHKNRYRTHTGIPLAFSLAVIKITQCMDTKRRRNLDIGKCVMALIKNDFQPYRCGVFRADKYSILVLFGSA